jgi:hypothetical protein
MDQLPGRHVGLGLVGHRLLRCRNREKRVHLWPGRQRRPHQHLPGKTVLHPSLIFKGVVRTYITKGLCTIKLVTVVMEQRVFV